LYGITVDDVLLVDGAAGASLVDTPTSYGTDTGVGGEVRGNYSTWNPLANPINATTFSNGNLEFVGTSGSHSLVRSSIAASSGKWYAEFSLSAVGGNYPQLGILDSTTSVTQANPYLGQYANGYALRSDGQKENNNNTSAYGSSFTTGDIIGVAFDADNGTLTYYKNGTSQGTAYSSIPAGSYLFAATAYNSGGWIANWGQRAFAYTAPSGFKSLCDSNLPAPVVAKPNTLMDVALWPGNGGSQTITLPGAFSPDFVWIKRRSSAFSSLLYDTIRDNGPNKGLISDSTTAEGGASDNATYGYLSAFNSTGFVLTAGSTSDYVNTSGQTYVGWAWDAGTTTVTDNAGSIQSTRRTNQAAGFSIVSYSGNGSSGSTVGHGLNAAPSFLICKRRNTTENWCVYHQSVGNTAFLKLDATNGAVSFNAWASTTPTSTVFSIGNIGETNSNIGTYVCYAFAPVSGYSSAFSYTGNGDSSGPFVYLGFRPRFIIQKRTDSAGSWLLIDTARDPVNVARNELFANAGAAEYDNGSLVDVLSNGFKIRATFANMNASGGSFIGYAFAENPFQYARAR
jgi:hypothetical protein